MPIWFCRAAAGDYSEDTLNRLLYENRLLVDHWDKNMAIWPIDDWPRFHRTRLEFQKRYRKREEEFRRVRGDVLDLIEKKGYISSADIERKEHNVSWSWAPTTIGRAVLESIVPWGRIDRPS